MADEPPTQQPAQGADKAQAPATFSSFINKSASGKKFAPKAARRRPGAAPAPAAKASAAAASAPAPAPAPVPAPVSSTAEPPSSQAAPATSTADANATTVEPPLELAVAAPLPTPEPTQDAVPTPELAPTQQLAPTQEPVITQEPATQSDPTPAPVPTAPSSSAAAGPVASQPAAVSTSVRGANLLNYARTLASPRKVRPTVEQSQPTHARNGIKPPVFLPREDERQGSRSPKRRRIESPSRQSTPMMPVAPMLPQQLGSQTEAAQIPAAVVGEPDARADATSSNGVVAFTQSGSSTQPWTAVNHAQEDGGEATGAVEPPAKKKRAPPKPRAKKKTTTVEGHVREPQEDGEEAEPTQKRTSTKARGKSRAKATEVGEDGEPVEAPPKKPRNTRKDKGKQPAVDGAADGEVEGGEPGQEGEAVAKPKPKPRAPPRRKKSATAEGEEGSVEPKRRGRPPREDTPSDAEDYTIDPDSMCMDDLASRNIRVGKLSRREKEMRKIDWDAVKQRRREEDARHISTKESQAAVDKLLEMGETEQAPTGPRYHVVDGRIELIQDSGLIDRERDADREIEMMTITEEDDLTTRITSRSFMKNNKRFPNEFVLPGQGKRWTAESTAMFYQGLRSFGTDFQMIAHMFPGMTRRSIKTKFTREERENPDIVRDCLRGTSQLASHWGDFLAASQLEEDSFADADAIKRELEEEEARMREQINEALKEKEEREKQKKLAGLTEEGEGTDAAANAKGKKKRKQKDKSVAFVEEGVEILGDVDDDPNWGQE
ncbi:Transcription factor TFIIIB component B [Curvularia kusanoi]|uniref:Transcription factor TFIIIB component B n=1 Tax=Curvularia kusanoi TaxID=90978 RepID=A0A9P4WAA0_CURKU|nr:Transcription factor TFIIIB component B [Curvularia kusanoi]